MPSIIPPTVHSVGSPALGLGHRRPHRPLRVGAVVVMLFASLLPLAHLTAIAAPASAAGATSVLGRILVADPGANSVLDLGTGGTPNAISQGAWSYPTGVAMGSAGDLFVADPGNNRIIRIPAGTTSGTDIGSGLSHPGGVAVGADGNAYVADTGNNRIVAIASDGTQRLVTANVSAPGGVAVDPLGNTYVADTGNSRVVKVAIDGSISKLGAGFVDPQGVAVDVAGNVYVADTGNNRVVAITPDGTTHGVGEALSQPSGVALDAFGNVFVADSGTGRIVEIATTGAQSTVASGLAHPTGVTVYAPAPRFGGAQPPASASVGAAYQFAFNAFNVPGAPAPQFQLASGSLPPGIGLSPTGLLAGSPSTAGTYTFVPMVANVAQGQLGDPVTITVAAEPDSHVWYCAAPNGTIQDCRSGATKYDGFSYPVAVDIDRAGNFYVVDQGRDQVVKIDRANHRTIIGSGLLSPAGVAVDLEGDVYIADSGHGRIVEVTPDGDQSTLADDLGTDRVRGIAVDAAGNVYAAQDTFVYAYDPNGHGTALAAGMDAAYDVALDTEGNVYVTEWGSDEIDMITPDHTVEIVGPHPGHPTGIAVTADGAVGVAAFGDANSRNFSEFASPPFGAIPGLPRLTPRPVSLEGVARYSPGPTFANGTLPDSATVDEPFSFTFGIVVPSGQPSPTFSVASGQLPPGLTLNPSTGELSGTPTATGRYTFVPRVANLRDGTVGRPVTITVGAFPVLGAVTPPDGVVGLGYHVTFGSTGSPVPTIAVSSGSLPPGLTLSPTGSINGTPTTSGRFDFAISATNYLGTDTSRPLSITIVQVPVFTDDSPSDTLGLGTTYSYQFATTDPLGITYSVASGSLPPGLTLDPSTGELSGVPTAVGSYPYTVAATNAAGRVTTSQLTMQVTSAPNFSTMPPGVALVDQPYSFTFEPTGNPAPAFSLASGTLPNGLTLTSAGVLSGTPNTTGVFTFTVSATSPGGTVTSGAIRITVASAPAFTGATPPSTGVVGSSYGYTFTAEGSPAPTFTVVSGALPQGLTLDSATGALTGIPTAPGTSTFTIRAHNAAGSVTSEQLRIEVATPDVAFVRAAYHDFLHRAPTEAELRSATLVSYSTGAARAGLLGRLSRSPDWITATVKEFYVDTLGREGEPDGVRFWTQQIASGNRTVSDVAAFFYSSSEYFSGFGHSDTRTWIVDLYTKLLSRDGRLDPTGVAFWVGRTPSLGRERVARGFYQSSESRHARVAVLYQTLLGRAPETGGWDYWSNVIGLRGDLSLAASLAASDEYYVRSIARFGDSMV